MCKFHKNFNLLDFIRKITCQFILIMSFIYQISKKLYYAKSYGKIILESFCEYAPWTFGATLGSERVGKR